MSDRLYYNFNINNDTNSSMVLDQTDRRLSSLLENPSEYCLSVLKFSLPTESIDAFSILDPSSFQLKLQNDLDNNAIPNTFNNISATNSLPLSTSYKYTTYADFIEAFNRVSLQTHRDLLQSFNAQCSNVIVKTGTYSLSVSTSPYVHEQSITLSSTDFDNGSNTMGVSTRLGYLKVNFKSGLISSDNRQHPIRVYIVDPTGNKCLLFADLTCSTANTLTFEDCSFNTLDSVVDNTQPLPQGQYQPREAFLKLNNIAGSSGIWKLRIESAAYTDSSVSGSTTFIQDVSYEISWYFTPKGKKNEVYIHQYAPALSIIDATSKLELLLHESFYYGNSQILLSPKLFSVLGFDGTLNNGFYKLKMPQIFLSNTLAETSFIKYVQPVSTAYKLTSIRSIQIRSNTIPAIGEYSISSNSSIIMSIDLNTTTIKDRYEFQSSLPRWFDLVGNQALSDINFSIWVEYNNGSVLQAYIPPYSKFSLLAIFCKKDKTNN